MTSIQTTMSINCANFWKESKHFSYQQVEHTALSDHAQTLHGEVTTQFKDRSLHYRRLTYTSCLSLCNSTPCWPF